MNPRPSGYEPDELTELLHPATVVLVKSSRKSGYVKTLSRRVSSFSIDPTVEEHSRDTHALRENRSVPARALPVEAALEGGFTFGMSCPKFPSPPFTIAVSNVPPMPKRLPAL